MAGSLTSKVVPWIPKEAGGEGEGVSGVSGEGRPRCKKNGATKRTKTETDGASVGVSVEEKSSLGWGKEEDTGRPARALYLVQVPVRGVDGCVNISKGVGISVMNNQVRIEGQTQGVYLDGDYTLLSSGVSQLQSTKAAEDIGHYLDKDAG
ncbi:hypothetical protein BCR39DRAFT_507541 [Naematelia encephala]|uniref:Uncharacterized protein n=1 Tax=Naematelia encephala TaxID=71784 RepID=A0A1Y2ANY4_9TREE|nr:hypothetical protein BCR39DRAFT_507541 [Naematelia encephala]